MPIKCSHVEQRRERTHVVDGDLHQGLLVAGETSGQGIQPAYLLERHERPLVEDPSPGRELGSIGIPGEQCEIAGRFQISDHGADGGLGLVEHLRGTAKGALGDDGLKRPELLEGHDK